MTASDIPERVAAVRQRADIAALVGAATKLSRGRNPRGKCPFHGSKSDSLAVYPESGKARCWGCGWSGDAIGFVQDFYGLDFIGALTRLEGDYGLEGVEARPVQRHKQERAWQPPETVPSYVVARTLWQRGQPDFDSLRVWLRARRVPEAMLHDRWLSGLRFCPSGPISAWPVGKGPDAVAHAPAMLGLIRRVVMDGQRTLAPIGVHATFLSPGLRAKMNRKRANGDAVAARKMFGESKGGVVVLGQYSRDCPLFVGEGIETVLSGMALCGAADDACGLAVLSLDNLQGRARLWKNGALPLFDVQPDPARGGVAFAHDGPVTGLIDADMAPLPGPKDRETGVPRGFALVERRGGPLVHRTITSAERSEICAALFVKLWRAAGCRRVRAVRPHMGMDFNDLAQQRETIT